MYEISDRYGEIIAIISEKEYYTVNRAKQLYEGGYKASEIAEFFNVSVNMVKKSLNIN